MNCAKCGAKLRSNATFCNNCGQKVVSLFPIIGMVGIAIFMGLIIWFWDILAEQVMLGLLLCASFFLLICYFLPLKYALLSMVILGVLDIYAFDLQVQLHTPGFKVHYSLLIGILCRLLTILIVHALAKIKNNFLFYICPIIIISTVLGSLAWQCMYWNAIHVEMNARSYFFRNFLIDFLRNPLIPLVAHLIGSCLASGIYLWVRKSYPQFLQKLR